MSDQQLPKKRLLVFQEDKYSSPSQSPNKRYSCQPPSISKEEAAQLWRMQQLWGSSPDYEEVERAYREEYENSYSQEMYENGRNEQLNEAMIQQDANSDNGEEYEDSNSYRKQSSNRRFITRQPEFQRKRGKNKYNKSKDNFDEQAWKLIEAKDIMKFKTATVDNFIDKSALAGQTIKEIDGIQVYFPYQPYKLQAKYMEKVIEAIKTSQNAILESPTGTGKSLCLLSAALSWVQSEKICGRHRKIIYLSRTHSQLTQVSKELHKTCFRPTMAHVASRDLLCVKPEIETLKGREKMEACSKGVKLALKDKEGHIDWEKMPEEQAKETLKIMCKVYRQKQASIELGKLNFSNQIIEMDDFKAAGKQFNFCPYYYPFHMDQYCDMFLMPYNYILDTGIMSRFDAMIANSVIIFDQAHNVPDASCEGRSSEIFQSNQQGAETEIQGLLFSKKESLMSIRKSSFSQIKTIEQFFEDLKSTTSDFLLTIPFMSAPDPSKKVYKTEESHERVKVFDEENIQMALYEIFMGTIMDESEREVFQKKSHHFSKCMEAMIKKINNIELSILSLIQQLKESEEGNFHNMEKVCGFWKKVAVLLSPFTSKQTFAEKQLNHYRLVIKIQLEQQQTGFNGQMLIKDYSLQLRCLVPWLTFKEITAREPRCIIFTSGTLSPLQSYENELGIEAPIKLVNKHVISQKQVQLNIVKKNIQGHTLDFRYKNICDNSLNIYRELTETLFEISKKVPSGMLVVCPNFKTLRELKYHVNMRENLKRMTQVKAQIFEERGGEKYIQQFKNKSQKGAILYCVCRGRASEGIDFPDHHCRAVVFVGIPFPNIGDPILIEKKEHFWKLQKMKQKEKFDIPSISWQKWYFNGTMRAINQSLGRLIRHSKDYGMLFLLDERYAETRFQKALPQWTQMSINIWYEISSRKIEGIESFYEENQAMFTTKPIKQQKKPIVEQQQQPQKKEGTAKKGKLSTNEAIAKIANFVPKSGKVTAFYPMFTKGATKSKKQ